MDPWNQTIRSLGTALASMPAMRAQAKARQEQQQVAQAHIGQMNAGAEASRAAGRQHDAETSELIRKGSLVDALQKMAPAAERAMVEGRFDDPAIDQMNGAIAGLTGINKGDIGNQIKQGMGTLLARMGNIKGAAAVEDPNKVYKVDADNAAAVDRPMNVPPGGAVWQGGKFVDRNPSASTEEYETTSQEIPEVPAQEAVPEHREGGFMGMGGKVVPAQPAVPYQPKKTVTTRRKLSSVMTPASAPAADGEVAPPKVQPAPRSPSGGKVRVQHPNGQFGLIPADQVDAALAQGYKLAK